MNFVDIEPVLVWLRQEPQWITLALVVVAFTESFAVLGILVPGILLLAGIAGISAATGFGVLPALISVYVGAVAGDAVSYAIGLLLGRRLGAHWPFRNHPNWLATGRRFFKHKGRWGLVLGRFIGPVRPVLPLVAGSMSMPLWRFMPVNLVTAVGWAMVSVLPGYLFGLSLRTESRALQDATVLLVGLGLLLAGVRLYGLVTNALLQPGRRLQQLMAQSRLNRWSASRRPGETDHCALPLLAMALLTTASLVWLLIVPTTNYGALLIETLNRESLVVSTASRQVWVATITAVLERGFSFERMLVATVAIAIILRSNLCYFHTLLLGALLLVLLNWQLDQFATAGTRAELPFILHRSCLAVALLCLLATVLTDVFVRGHHQEFQTLGFGLAATVPCILGIALVLSTPTTIYGVLLSAVLGSSIGLCLRLLLHRFDRHKPRFMGGLPGLALVVMALPFVLYPLPFPA